MIAHSIIQARKLSDLKGGSGPGLLPGSGV